VRPADRHHAQQFVRHPARPVEINVERDPQQVPVRSEIAERHRRTYRHLPRAVADAPGMPPDQLPEPRVTHQVPRLPGGHPQHPVSRANAPQTPDVVGPDQFTDPLQRARWHYGVAPVVVQLAHHIQCPAHVSRAQLDAHLTPRSQ
jgi:hypothetical protein